MSALEGPADWITRLESEGITTVEAANRLADVRAREPHPIWGDRAHRIVRSLVDGDWERA